MTLTLSSLCKWEALREVGKATGPWPHLHIFGTERLLAPPSVLSVHIIIARDLFYLYLAFIPESCHMQLNYGVESISLSQEYLKKSKRRDESSDEL